MDPSLPLTPRARRNGLAALVGAACLAGCYSPDLSEGQFSCAPEAPGCPDGYACDGCTHLCLLPAHVCSGSVVQEGDMAGDNGRASDASGVVADAAVDPCAAGGASEPVACAACVASCAQLHVVGASCSAGVCAGPCALNYADCDGLAANGCEVDLLGDANNCNGCGEACSTANIAAPACAGGRCSGACNSGYADCDGDKRADGCEAALNTDLDNCGGCGVACSDLNMSMPRCNNGQCNGDCAQGYDDCDHDKQTDGCETDLLTDVMNCGGCNNACSTANVATPQCQGGNCAGACDPGYADCNNNLRGDGCEVYLPSDAHNCGGCGVSCGGNFGCTGGVCGCMMLMDCRAGSADSCTGNLCACGTHAPCGSGATCNFGRCLLLGGASCTSGSQCASGVCRGNGTCF